MYNQRSNSNQFSTFCQRFTDLYSILFYSQLTRSKSDASKWTGRFNAKWSSVPSLNNMSLPERLEVPIDDTNKTDFEKLASLTHRSETQKGEKISMSSMLERVEKLQMVCEANVLKCIFFNKLC